MNKHKTISVNIQIESEITIGLRAEFSISDVIFTEYDRLLNYEEIRDNIRLAIKKAGNYKMLTATLGIRNANEYGYNANNIESSFRIINRYDEVTMSRWNGDSYNNFQPFNAKEMMSLVKDLVDRGNKKYIEFIKQ